MLRRLLPRDLGLKLLAFALAVAFWIQMAGQPVVERGIDVPLGFENVPERLHVGGDLPDTVRVRVRGASSIVAGLQPGDVVAAIDLAGERSGRRLFDMFADRVRAPFGVEVVQVVPATLAVSLEPAGEPRLVPVAPDIEGRPAAGFAIGHISVTPPTVAVVGPAARVAGLAEALTEPVPIAGASGGLVRKAVTIGVADPLVRLQTPGTAEVTVEIVPAPSHRTLPAVPVRAGEGGGAASVEPAVVRVDVRGPPDAVQALDDTAIAASIDLAGLRPGRYNLPVTVESPSAVGVTRIDPSRVTVVVR